MFGSGLIAAGPGLAAARTSKLTDLPDGNACSAAGSTTVIAHLSLCAQLPTTAAALLPRGNVRGSLKWGTAIIAIALTLVGCGQASKPTVRADYSGTGTTTLEPFTLQQGRTLRWSSSGGMFFLIATNYAERPDIANPQLVVSQAKAGTVYLSPGRYVLKVSTEAGDNWALTFA